MASRSDLLNLKQKVAITVFCIVIPLLGPLIIHALLQDELSSRENESNNLFDYMFLCSALTHSSNVGHHPSDSGESFDVSSSDDT
ncbi:hypothetical protein [Aliiglaciecola sp. M165]|uniref:hypothetical protein n=1 Tax=Aliiglaciecola sp. M165 TaxID=2593649 RepID=UPI00117F2272|nr:hypothetical protein [Aliiglaciecola sp. M165]TRY28680.1 hypothetical protein FM019_20685 [Aliiglaciecola sp. M165]